MGGGRAHSVHNNTDRMLLLNMLVKAYQGTKCASVHTSVTSLEHPKICFRVLQSLDEHDHMMFVLHHLNEILELLMEPGNTNRKVAHNFPTV